MQQDQHPLVIFNRWKTAHQRATDMESALFQAALLSTSGGGQPPTEADWNRAKTLRGEARQLFRQAMAAVDQLNARAARVQGPPPVAGPRTRQAQGE